MVYHDIFTITEQFARRFVFIAVISIKPWIVTRGYLLSSLLNYGELPAITYCHLYQATYCHLYQATESYLWLPVIGYYKHHHIAQHGEVKL